MSEMRYTVTFVRYDRNRGDYSPGLRFNTIRSARMMAHSWLDHDCSFNGKGEYKAQIYESGTYIGEVLNTAGDIRYWYPCKINKGCKRRYRLKADGKITEGEW